MASYKSLHFQCPDPLSKEAVSRTTRYRLRKKRKVTSRYESQSVKATERETDPLEYRDMGEELQCDSLEAGNSDMSESDSETHDLAHASTNLGTARIEYIHSSAKEMGSLEVIEDEMLQGLESEYPFMNFGGHDHYLEVSADDDPSAEELRQNDLEVADYI